MATEQVPSVTILVEAPSQYSHQQDIVSIIIFGYVLALCVFALIGMMGVAIVTWFQNSRACVTRSRRDGYQTLE